MGWVRKTTRLTIGAAFFVGLWGCMETIPLESEPSECFDCHGAAEQNNAAPPPAFWRADLVDAHQSHLRESTWHQATLCESCHIVPDITSAAGHIDTELPAEITWGGIAAADDADPVYDAQTATCQGVYCHGSTLETEATATELSWISTDGSQAACGTCHSLPPGGDHPDSEYCSNCHGDVVDSEMVFINPDLHINGAVDVGEMACDACHGANGEAAPPPDVSGNQDAASPGVGAHQPHMQSSDWRAAIECEQCHLVPVVVGDVGHVDTDLPAEVTWGERATADGAVPQIDETYKCSDVYCHGATLWSGGSNTTPVWTVDDGTQAACGTCHGLPPESAHPNDTDCSSCHSEVIDDSLNFIAPDRHIDGVVDLRDMACNACHGEPEENPDLPTSWAPPADLSGNSATTEPGVGAHQQHLAASTWRGPVGCEDCHTVPSSVRESGHMDDLQPAELTWSELATSEDAVPAYDFTTQACVDSYCHGSTIGGGGTNNEPIWTAVGEGEAACGTCHSLPPTVGHPSQTECENCHSSVVEAGLSIICGSLHINGDVDLGSTECPDDGS